MGDNRKVMDPFLVDLFRTLVFLLAHITNTLFITVSYLFGNFCSYKSVEADKPCYEKLLP